MEERKPILFAVDRGGLGMMEVKRKVAKGFPPSVFIIEEMEERGWSKETLAEKMLVTLAYLEPILVDKRRLTIGACHSLGKAFDTGPELWANLQKAWDEWLAAQ